MHRVYRIQCDRRANKWADEITRDYIKFAWINAVSGFYILYITASLQCLRKKKSLEPFNPTCNLEKKIVSTEPIIKFDSFDFEKGFSSSVDTANI